ncbi:MAG: AMP-binding protein [Candidatus Bipolaricaulota bacterium]|nr:MAG: AMP-binding protein [Candidatus Bipolaricaulota bacterium]
MRYTPETYQEELRSFTWEIPPDFNIVDVVERHAKERPDRVAVIWEDDDGNERRVSFREIATAIRAFGSSLIGLGVSQGDPVLHVLPRLPEAHVAQLGTFVAGGVAVPCSEMLKASEIAYRAEVSGAPVIVADASVADTVESVRDQCPLETFILIGADGPRDGWLRFEDLLERGDPEGPKVALTADDPMTINFTSGTTGNPKPVVHKHRWMYCHHRVTARYWYDASAEDVIWATTAPGWAKWYWSPIGVSLTTGATQFMYNGRYDAERYLALMEKHGITKLCATPTEFRLFAQLPDMGRFNLVLKDALSAGEPLNVEPIEAFKRAFGVTIRDGYGQTESICLVCNLPGLPVKPGAMGMPTPGPGVVLIDLDGNPVDRGEIGEISLKPGSPAIFDGYWKAPDLDEEVFSGGWYRTGDLARMDEDGYLFFEGRADDVILTSGYRIGPFEVEDALVSHPAVVEAAAVAAPHRERGEIVKAFVILADGYSPSEELTSELQGHVKSVTAPYKYPRAIEYITELPKTTSGKIKRAELKAKEWEGWDRR